MSTLLLVLLSAASLCASTRAQVTCTAQPTAHGCYADMVDGKTRILDNDFMSSGDMTHVACAAICFKAGLPLAGVEYATECHCGTGFNPGTTKTVLPTTKCDTPCSGDKAETCGGTDALQLLNFTCTGKILPNYKGCANTVSKALPYCDTTLSVDERVAWLMHNFTLDEKIAMISPQPSLGETCGDHTAGKDSIGLPAYFWLVEANTNIAAACHTTPWKCATTFIGPMGMGASFNRTSWHLKGSVMGTEMRAFHNLAWHRGNAGDLVGLTGFGPNINIARDPRFGRSSELPGEDPYLNGHYAAEMVRGMQQPDKQGHPLMLTYLKHFTAYSTENNRGHDTYNISLFDYWDSYLAQYEIAFLTYSSVNASVKGSAAAGQQPSGVMCSYDAENGHPSCANSYILNDVLRDKWKQEHAFVTTDCGAVSNMLGPPVNAPGNAEAAAWTLMNGTDLEMGSTIWTEHMKDAIAQGLATEEAVTRSAARGLRQLFLAGRFDPPEQVGWSSLNAGDINTTLAQTVSREAGLQGMVLLKNEQNILPLKAGTHSIAVVGPMAINQDLMSDYAGGTGEGGCWPKADESCIVTIGNAIANANANGSTSIHKGVDVNSNVTDGIQAALDAVNASDIAVLVLGNDRTQEHEGIDRPDINLPGLQSSFAQQVLALGKPTLLVLSNGGAVAIDELIERCDGIVESFNPAHQAPALADLLFGHENRWGKLPVTVYPHAYTSEQSMVNYDMSSNPGRTYRYYPTPAAKSKPLFEFGFGLSYTSFALACRRSSSSEEYDDDVTFTVSCDVENTGSREGDAVVMAYHSASESIRSTATHPVPKKSLVDFARVTIPAGQSTTVSFNLDASKALSLVNESGERYIYKGEHALLFDLGDGKSAVAKVSVIV